MDQTAAVIVLVAVIAAVPPTIAAVAAYRQAQKVAEKAEVIHTLVNSNLAAVRADLVIANERIVALLRLVDDLRSGRAG